MDCGEIERADVLTNGRGRSKGHGIVLFYSERGAQKALDMDGKNLQGRNMSVKIDEFPN